MTRWRLPPVIVPFTRRPWPAAGLLLACFLVLWLYALPSLTAAADMRESTGRARALTERQAALAAQAPIEEARNVALLEWWESGAGQRIGGRSIETASAALLDLVRTRCEGAGAHVARLERTTRTDVLSETPSAQVVSVRVVLNAERMEQLANALGALESDIQPWLRIGNVTMTRQPYRDLAGVQAEMIVYACLEAPGG